MKKILFTFFVIFLAPAFTFAQSSNVGIIQGIWFSEDVVFAGDPIRIYTAIQNNSGEDIEGVVEFFDNDISIGKKNFTALDRRVAELWMDTIVTEGTHDYSVIITEAAINTPGAAAQVITPRVIESDTTIIADIDTDGDDIGDMEDPDDDNDGFSDEQELKEGTNPQDKNSQPKPVDTIVANSSEGSSFIDEVLAILKPTRSSEPADIDLENTDSSNDPQDLIVNKPQFIQNFEDSYPIVSSVTTPLNTLQNNVVPKLTQERSRAITKIQPAPARGKVPEQGIDTDIDALAEYNHGLVGWQYWLWSIYSWLLLGMKWIFSCLICMILLIFIGIHIFLKILFGIFRGKRDRFS